MIAGFRLVKLSLAFAFMFLAGCAQSIATVQVDDYRDLLSRTFRTYVYWSGEGESFRMAFLQAPDTGIEVVPYTKGILEAQGTFAEALTFVVKGRGSAETIVEEVRYQGRMVGYLITLRPLKIINPLQTDASVRVFERGGKVYFSIEEKIDDT